MICAGVCVFVTNSRPFRIVIDARYLNDPIKYEKLLPPLERRSNRFYSKMDIVFSWSSRNTVGIFHGKPRLRLTLTGIRYSFKSSSNRWDRYSYADVFDEYSVTLPKQLILPCHSHSNAVWLRISRWCYRCLASKQTKSSLYFIRKKLFVTIWTPKICPLICNELMHFINGYNNVHVYHINVHGRIYCFTKKSAKTIGRCRNDFSISNLKVNQTV